MNKLCLWLLVFNAVASAACGAIKNDNGSVTGSGGSGGRSVEDDGAAKPPPARGALSLHFDAIDPADPVYGSSECLPGPHWANVPYQRDRPMADQTQQTTDSDAPFVAVSGEGGDRLYCRIAPRGTAFEVSADITGYAEFEGQKLRPTVAQISITAISADQADGIGRITIQDDAATAEYSDEGCVFSTQGGTLGVEAGRLWAKVKCDYLSTRSSPGRACRINTGVLLLENCSQ